MSVRTDQVNLIININGDNAKKQLNDQRKIAADLRAELAGLKKGSAEYLPGLPICGGPNKEPDTGTEEPGSGK